MENQELLDKLNTIKSFEIKDNQRHFFNIGSRLSLVGFSLLAVLPTWEYTFQIVNTICIVDAILYIHNILTSLKIGKNNVESYSNIIPNYNKSIKSFSTINGVFDVFKNGSNYFLLAGWIHYLCFDLLIAKQIVVESLQSNIPWPLVVLSLYFTLMFGPAGFALFSALKLIFI
ncbi:hypothetical protein K502DRAFT_322387 [Neoconidiobolus thromboides FSU 785]|nr:hypothetical protein K502DRAFT_322387 [Neoconidiobolus thromboides FSU 785]